MNELVKKNVVVPTVTRMTITPDMAINWLEKINASNRPLSDAHVERLARDMKEGRWLLTHQGIAFAPDGALLDGQHRLWAIVQANVPVELHVWSNVPPESLMSVDTGKTRSLADVLHLGGGFGKVTIKEVAVLRTMLGGMKGPAALSPAEAAEALQRYRVAIAFSFSALPDAKYISNATTRAVMARASCWANRSKLAEFGHMLASGIVPNAGHTSVILLRQHLQSNTGVTWPERRERYAKTERALVAFIEGDSITRLYAATHEMFPLNEDAKEESHG